MPQPALLAINSNFSRGSKGYQPIYIGTVDKYTAVILCCQLLENYFLHILCCILQCAKYLQASN